MNECRSEASPRSRGERDRPTPEVYLREAPETEAQREAVPNPAITQQDHTGPEPPPCVSCACRTVAQALSIPDSIIRPKIARA